MGSADKLIIGIEDLALVLSELDFGTNFDKMGDR